VGAVSLTIAVGRLCTATRRGLLCPAGIEYVYRCPYWYSSA